MTETLSQNGAQVVGNATALDDAILRRKAQQIVEAEETSSASTSAPASLPLAVVDAPSGAALLAQFGEPQPNYHPFDVLQVDGEGNSQVVTYYVRQLSPKQESTLDARISRRQQRMVTVQEQELEDATACAMVVSETLYRKVGEADGVPQFERMFSLDEILGRDEEKNSKGQVLIPRVIGLFELTDARGKQLAERFVAECLSLHPTLNPQLKKMAARQMMRQVWQMSSA